MKLVKILLSFLGKLYRDIVVMCSEDYIEYTLRNGYFIYKNILPFNMTLGMYKFLKDADFYALIHRI